jgi:hypothetical protein
MESSGLLSICLSALVAVFIILSLLAIIIRLLTAIFPDKITKEDSAVFAALSTVVNHHYPGSKITKIEETT